MTPPNDQVSGGNRGPIESSASFSDDGLYRYDLARRWGPGPLVLWVMLNPSTADSSMDDPTLRRCMAFAHTWECGGCAIVNLYAYRSPDPKALTSIDDPVGPDNERYLESWLSKPADEVRYVVAGWGDKIPPHRQHPPVFLMAERLLRPLYCLGRTKKGRPRHPLYVADGTKRELLYHPSALR